MYLGEQLVDSVEINLSGYGANGKVSLDLMDRINELKKKHKTSIEKANAQPVFYLGNIPSSINNFRSLKNQHDGNGERRPELVKSFSILSGKRQF